MTRRTKNESLLLHGAERDARVLASVCQQARKGLAELESDAVAARESGEQLSAEWWAEFGSLHTEVRLLERQLSDARMGARDPGPAAPDGDGSSQRRARTGASDSPGTRGFQRRISGE